MLLVLDHGRLVERTSDVAGTVHQALDAGRRDAVVLEP
jgi:hypothetical protein